MEKVNFKDYNSPFATRLRVLMDERNVKRIELAELLGVSRQSIGQYCDGTSLPPADKIIVLADYFDVSTDYLLGRTDVKITDTTIKSICEYTGLSENAILTIAEGLETLTDNWQAYRDVLSDFIDSMPFPNILAYILDYKEVYFLKCDLEKKAVQVVENAYKLSKKQTKEEGNKLFSPTLERLYFLRDNDYYDIEEKCDVSLYRAQRELSVFMENYAKEEYDKWQA